MRTSLSSNAFVPMADIIPIGTSGLAHIEHFEVSEDASRFSALRGFRSYVPEGRYARLMVDGQLYMTDTQHEHSTNYGVVRESRGSVLIAGLGLGMLLIPILKKPDVNLVTVVEKYPDVIDLVEQPIRRALSKNANDKLTIIPGDIYEWRPAPKQKFDVIYFDIWADQSTDDLKDMDVLHKAFRKYRAKGGWMQSWNRAFLQDQKKRGRC